MSKLEENLDSTLCECSSCGKLVDDFDIYNCDNCGEEFCTHCGVEVGKMWICPKCAKENYRDLGENAMMLDKLLYTALNLSTIIHELEVKGVELSSRQDALWEAATVVIEEAEQVVRSKRAAERDLEDAEAILCTLENLLETLSWDEIVPTVKKLLES